MTMVRRRVILLTFVAVYCIIAPLLIFYALGWRYNFHNRNFERVGAILIETDPRGAIVTLNGQQQSVRTPTTLKNLLADKYTINLSKSGYYPWMTTISVASSETSRITNITLLSEPRITQTVPGATDRGIFVVSPDMNSIAISQPSAIDIYSADGSEKLATITAESPIRAMQWSSDSTTILAELETGNFILASSQTGEKLPPMELPNNEIVRHAQWSNTEPDVLFVSSDSSTYRINIFQKTTTKRAEVSNVIYATDTYHFQGLNERINILNISGLSATDTSLPLCPGMDVREYSRDITLIFCEDASKLFIFRQESNELEQFENEVRGIDIRPGDDSAIYFNKHEIFKWNLRTNQKELLLRTSYEIFSAHSFLAQKYVLFAQNGIIRALQAEGPERNSYDLPYTDIEELSVNAKSSSVWVRDPSRTYVLQF